MSDTSRPPVRTSEGERDRRRRSGAWSTPPELVDELVGATLDGCRWRGRSVRILDPACGDGRFLVAAAERVRARGGEPVLVGVDVDPGAVRAARQALADEDADLRVGDALGLDWGAERFDVVLGNPPFLSQLAADTARGGASRHGGGPYADAAVEFLALAVRLARPPVGRSGARIGLVLPLSVLASRDAAAVRHLVAEHATLRWLWWSPTPVFDAQVRTCAMVLEVGGEPGRPASRAVGPEFTPAPCLHRVALAEGHGWGTWIADDLGLPALPALSTDGVFGHHAAVSANFRDEYYGLVGRVREQAGDDDPAPPLVTTGVIDPGRCRWGEVPVQFAKRRFQRPVVELAALDPRMRRWAESKLVPKVLVATQTRVLEAVADPTGAWLPAVPVICAVAQGRSGRPASPWPLAAVLTSPVASAWIARRAAGTGLSAGTVRVSVAHLGELPWPEGDLGPAVRALRRGDLATCGARVVAAYGLDPEAGSSQALVGWWLTAATERRGSPPPRQR